MKDEEAYFAGNCEWDQHQSYIWNKDKKGRLFSGINTDSTAKKERVYTDLTFRICKEESK